MLSWAELLQQQRKFSIMTENAITSFCDSISGSFRRTRGVSGERSESAASQCWPLSLFGYDSFQQIALDLLVVVQLDESLVEKLLCFEQFFFGVP